MTDYQFFSLRARTYELIPEPLEVFSYPMGDVTVRERNGVSDKDAPQVLLVSSAAPDWSVVYAWASVRADSPQRILVLPYLPSARGDKDTPSPARVNARLAALSGITALITIDPHSPVWLDELGGISPGIQVRTMDLPSLIAEHLRHNGYTGVIAPDKGAIDRAAQAAKALRVPLHTATKQRDHATGKLTNYRAPDEVRGLPGRYLVVDDICDGGGTFALLAQAFSGTDVELDLWVTHGGFTKGVGNLMQHYREVHTTDSLPSARAALLEARRIMEGSRFHMHLLHWQIVGAAVSVAEARPEDEARHG